MYKTEIEVIDGMVVDLYVREVENSTAPKASLEIAGSSLSVVLIKEGADAKVLDIIAARAMKEIAEMIEETRRVK